MDLRRASSYYRSCSEYIFKGSKWLLYELSYWYVNNFVCLCDVGFACTRDTDIDDCTPSPCVNGTCDRTNSFICECDMGFTGDICDINININDCEPESCENGTCVDLINDFSCDCFAGFTGDTCDIDIDNCTRNPCINGTCTDLIDDYTSVLVLKDLLIETAATLSLEVIVTLTHVVVVVMIMMTTFVPVCLGIVGGTANSKVNIRLEPNSKFCLSAISQKFHLLCSFYYACIMHLLQLCWNIFISDCSIRDCQSKELCLMYSHALL